MANRTEKEWERIASRHESSLASYISIASKLDDAAWRAPVAEGKWSPMEITEHLRAAYEILLREQETGVGLRPRAGFALRTFLRLAILPSIFRKRSFPAGAKAPKEIRPTKCIEDRTEALAKLRELGERCAAVLGEKRSDPNAKLTHHLFGSLTPAKGLDFVTIHLENHTRQLPGNHD
ncbi:hypothetical protein BH24ACI3_BH24ACI3_06350 [soil metagenome]